VTLLRNSSAGALAALAFGLIPAVWAADKPAAVDLSFAATGAASLAPGDLKLSIDGKDQPITAVRKVTAAPPTAALPPHTYTNRAGDPDAARAVSVIVLDGQNTQWNNTGAVREELAAALAQIKPEERVAIFVFGKSLQILSDFSDTPAVRAAKLKAFASEGGAGVNFKDLLMPVPQTGRAGMYDEQQRMSATINAVAGVAGALKGASGRKALIWVSADYPLMLGSAEADLSFTQKKDLSKSGDIDTDVRLSQSKDYAKAADGFVQELQKAGVAAYPVSARRLTLNPTETSSHVTNALGLDSTSASRVSVNDIAKALAARTGGAPSSDQDLGKALRAALDDSQNAYVLSFTPGKLAEGAEPHKIKLQARQKGCEIRVASGFFAAPTAPENQPPQQRLVAALSSPLDAPEIGLTAKVEPRDATSFTVTLRIDSRDLELTQQGGDWVGGIAMGMFQGTAGGEQLGKQMQSGGVSIPAADYQKTRADGGGVQFEFTVKREADARFIRFGVIDQRIPKAGSLTAPLD
jgi:VWFA-related protein